jgi:5-methylcytosine-specific restriction protein B
VRKEKFSTSAQYALFIDEVNRGNISAIFGELITLIEYDKRLGRKNEIIIELPYSKSKFSVPPNLAIYGTMNTADRSITLLDSALRRRFQFFEIRPNPNLLNPISFHDSVEVNLSSLLMKINDRITYFLGKDQCIGHSYFLQLKDSVSPERDLLKIFMSNVIPLLEEYFYNDIHKIRMVLGETSENPAYNFYEEDLPLQLSSLFNGGSVNEEIDEMPIAYKLNAEWVNALDKSSGISIPAKLFTKIYA